MCVCVYPVRLYAFGEWLQPTQYTAGLCKVQHHNNNLSTSPSSGVDYDELMNGLANEFTHAAEPPSLFALVVFSKHCLPLEVRGAGPSVCHQAVGAPLEP